jgi:Leu/Phe-tRNA-protein transferase
MLSYSGTGYPYIMPPENGDLLADWLEASYPDEFCVSMSFEPDFVDELCASGFIPMATCAEEGVEVLLPKLHVVRSVLRPCEVRVTRTARRESSRYAFRVDSRFEEVLDACIATHGQDWLRPPLMDCWRTLFATRRSRRSRFTSMELYRVAEGGPSGARLVAGEIGVFVGGAYTSLTGFKTESGSGTVQLAAAGRYLEAAGASLWDLGMPLDYKATLGAHNVSRAEFLGLFRGARGLSVSAAAGPLCARELVDRRAAIVS